MKVVIGIITDNLKRILITQRPLHVSHGGCWEFPGGKLEFNESADEALCRELKEELGIEIQQFHYLGKTRYQYPNQAIEFLIYHVTQFSGNPLCYELQTNIKWVEKAHLNIKDFPEANQAMFELILQVESLN